MAQWLRLFTSRKEIAHLRAGAARSDERLAEIERRMLELADGCTAAQARLEEAIDCKLAELGERIDADRERVARLSDRIGGLDDRVADLNERIDGLDDRVADLNDRIGGLDDQASKARIAATRLERQIAAHAEETGKITTALIERIEMIRRLPMRPRSAATDAIDSAHANRQGPSYGS